MQLRSVLFVACVLAVAGEDAVRSSFSEEVLLHKLAGDRLLVHFHFSMSSPLTPHALLLSPLMRDIAAGFPVQRLRVSLTRGLWRPAWGLCPAGDSPRGALVSATFLNNTNHNHSPPPLADSMHGFNSRRGIAAPVFAPWAAWQRLMKQLGAVLCSSLGSLAKEERVHVTGDAESTSYWGLLPGQTLCTENLVPWLQQLPCNEAQGVAALLQNRSLLFGADYQSLRMAVEYERGAQPSVSVQQTLTLVLRQQDAQELLGGWQGAAGLSPLLACPLAAKSAVLLGTQPHQRPVEVVLPQQHPTPALHDALVAISQLMDAAEQWMAAPLVVEQYALGRGDAHGQLVVRVRGPSLGTLPTGASVHLLQIMPWYLPTWLHGLQLSINGAVVSLFGPHDCGTYLQPHVIREAPSVLSLCVTVPPATFDISFLLPFDKGFMLVDEYPPDAEGGYDIPPVLVTLRGPPAEAEPGADADVRKDQTDQAQSGWQECSADGSIASAGSSAAAGLCDVEAATNSERAEKALLGDVDGSSASAAAGLKVGALSPSPLWTNLHGQRYYQACGRGAVVFLALPDFSMPYNVNCITSTLLALYVGAVLNTLIRRPRVAAMARADKRTRRRKRLMAAVLLLGIGCTALAYDKQAAKTVASLLPDNVRFHFCTLLGLSGC